MILGAFVKGWSCALGASQLCQEDICTIAPMGLGVCAFRNGAKACRFLELVRKPLILGRTTLPATNEIDMYKSNGLENKWIKSTK